ncbi:MAG: hypothetical protein CMJ35_11420 [Phycisphaerae bacterium]|nr:hypothetical protein [Phycisphaerae bacterium]
MMSISIPARRFRGTVHALKDQARRDLFVIDAFQVIKVISDARRSFIELICIPGKDFIDFAFYLAAVHRHS